MATANRRRSQRGNTLVESALVIVAYFYMLLGTVEFGRMVYTFHYLSHAARDGARYASLHGTSSSSPADATAVKNYLSTWGVGITQSDLTVTLSYTPNGNPGGNALVTLSYVFRPAVGYLFPSTLTLAARSKMTVLQ